MPLYVDDVVDPAAQALRVHGFERVSEVPAVPVRTGTRMRYDVRSVLGPAGEEWYLRSFGTGFVILPGSWRRIGLTRCYSVGEGLLRSGAGPASLTDRLLLAQAVLPDAAGADRLAEAVAATLQPLAERYAARVGLLGHRPSLSVAALLHG
jgi:hypothetical protein